MNISNVSQSSDWSTRASISANTTPTRFDAQRRQLQQATQTINQSGILGRNQIVFSIDSQTHRLVIQIEDSDTHTVVQQIPPEYLLELAQGLSTSSAETSPQNADT